MKRSLLAVVAILMVPLAAAAPAQAGPVATSQAEYEALGAVFPDPHAGCPGGPCDPNARGRVPARSFIGYREFIDGMRFMQSKPEWRRYMEVWPLDGKLDDNDPVNGQDPPAGTDANAAFPGNDLGRFEFTPRAEYRSAGIPTTTLSPTRYRSDLFVVRVTDETVPDAGKKRYALSLSIHGIERAGVEGGTRAIEELVTATAKGATPILPPEVRAGAPSIQDVLEKTIIYFTYPNPDGWLRGSVESGGPAFQRYNGNGVDVNRDWPDIGFAFRPYSGLSEPESRALAGFFGEVEAGSGQFAAGDDLHGQPFADALSYTLIPHGRKDWAKDTRIREASKTINRAQYHATKWSPIIQDNDQPQGGGPPCAPTALGDACSKIYAQTWGTVYDTINYTTTGALGDWFDSSIGLGADGIDNEMSFSHLDRNIVFEPNGEQLHVAGNKAIIYAHLADMLDPPSQAFPVGGAKAYVPNQRLRRAAKSFQPAPPEGTVAQSPIRGQRSEPAVEPDPDDPPGTVKIVFPFSVLRGPQTTGPDAGRDIFNGGMRVEVTTPNVRGVGAGVVSLKVQCKGCDEHPGVDNADEWVTISEDYNQSPAYLQAGVTVALNRPQAFKKDGTPTEWRAVLDTHIVGTPLPFGVMDVTFTRGRATTDGPTAGGDPPELAAYDVANTDFFEDLNKYIAADGDRFRALDPRKVISGEQSLAGLRSLVLADDPLPGYTGKFKGESGETPPSGPPTADMDISSSPTVPGAGSRAPGTFTEKRFTIGANDANGSMRVRIDWGLQANDFDMYLYRVMDDDEVLVGESASTQGTTNFEQIDVQKPAPGEYRLVVDNFASADPSWTGKITFTAAPPATETGTGAYTKAEKDAWFAKLREWVQGGGNLVLTDGALRALGELTDVPGRAVRTQTVYAGQTAFATSDSADTLADPLADDVDQPGARFNSGMRRQMYEPTPLGFSIQNPQSGSDESHSVQYDVDRGAFEAAGGRVAGTSADSGTRNAQAVYTRVTLGEVPVGRGQVRVAGALLPQPTTAFDHPLGLEPYAVTYTGYIVMRNLLRVAGEPGGGTPGTGTPGTGTPGTGTPGAGTPGAGSPGAGGPTAGTPQQGGRGTTAGARCGDKVRPRSSISGKSSIVTRTRLLLTGRTTDRVCGGDGRLVRSTKRLKRIEVAVWTRAGKRCRFVTASGRLSAPRACSKPVWLRAAPLSFDRASAKTTWRLRRSVRLPRGVYSALVRGLDPQGNVEVARRASNQLSRRVR